LNKALRMRRGQQRTRALEPAPAVAAPQQESADRSFNVADFGRARRHRGARHAGDFLEMPSLISRDGRPWQGQAMVGPIGAARRHSSATSTPAVAIAAPALPAIWGWIGGAAAFAALIEALRRTVVQDRQSPEPAPLPNTAPSAVPDPVQVPNND